MINQQCPDTAGVRFSLHARFTFVFVITGLCAKNGQKLTFDSRVLRDAVGQCIVGKNNVKGKR